VTDPVILLNFDSGNNLHYIFYFSASLLNSVQYENITYYLYSDDVNDYQSAVDICQVAAGGVVIMPKTQAIQEFIAATLFGPSE
jgi:hypothetical protein